MADLFDPTLKKKKKKKAVAFSEDPLGADADPTTPMPPMSPGSPGPTAHELTKMNGTSRDEDDEEERRHRGGVDSRLTEETRGCGRVCKFTMRRSFCACKSGGDVFS